MGWIGVDLDGTLAEYAGYRDGRIGPPTINPDTGQPDMLNRVLKWIADGQEVRIVTARVNPEGRPHRDVAWQQSIIKEWCRKYIGVELEVTCSKSYDMVALWDDRAVTVERNTGRVLTRGR